MKVVFDTNILISGNFWRGAPYRCLLSVHAGLVDLVVSPPIMEELERVLVTKFCHSADETNEVMALIYKSAILVEISGKLHVVEDDPDDDKFIETAHVAGAEYLVSGDYHLLAIGTYAGIKIITAQPFLELIKKLD